MTTKRATVIDVKHLTVSYQAKPALLDVSVQIESDQLVGVIGPNGAGKSTFIKAILGFVKPDLGTVQINGKSAQKAKGEVAYVPQRGAVDWDFPITVKEVALMGRYQQIPWYTTPKVEDHDPTCFENVHGACPPNGAVAVPPVRFANDRGGAGAPRTH